jgi:hypothetical protein
MDPRVDFMARGLELERERQADVAAADDERWVRHAIFLALRSLYFSV